MLNEINSKFENISSFFEEDFLPFLIVAHYDADGLISSSILAKLLFNEKIPFVLRISENLKPNELLESAFSKIIILDFQLKEDLAKIGEEKRILVIDHHPIKGDKEKVNLIHPSIFGYENEFDACSSTLSYLLAKHFDDSFIDLAPFVICGMLEDRHDREEKRSFRGLNKIVLDEAEEAGLINKKEGLISYCEFNEPLYKVVSLMFDPFMPNIFSSKERTIDFLKACGISESLINKNFEELNEKDHAEISQKIAIRLLNEGFKAAKVERIFGMNYELLVYSKSKNLRLIGKSIDYLARSLNYEGFIEALFNDKLYRFNFNQYFDECVSFISRIFLPLFQEKRIKEYKKFVLLKFEGKIDRFVGLFANLISASNITKHVVAVSSEFSKDEYKISFRAEEGSKYDLGSIVSNIAKNYQGSGGGHSSAAGAIIPKDYLEDFLEEFDNAL
jgi:RecJ-like exonuclease